MTRSSYTGRIARDYLHLSGTLYSCVHLARAALGLGKLEEAMAALERGEQAWREHCQRSERAEAEYVRVVRQRMEAAAQKRGGRRGRLSSPDEDARRR